MNAARILTIDLKLVFDANLSDSFEMSQLLLARSPFDGTLHLLTTGWERLLGYGRAEIHGKTLLELMWGDRRNTAAAVTAILDGASQAPVLLRLRCRNGTGKRLRFHRQYDEYQHVMYLLAEEAPAAGESRPGAERRSALRESQSRA
ncbi:MAG TPA: PAS domain-containing protein [Burkholderiales bacterium]